MILILKTNEVFLSLYHLLFLLLHYYTTSWQTTYIVQGQIHGPSIDSINYLHAT